MLEWMLIGVGFTGAFTLVHLYRAAIRKLGWIPSVESYFSPKGGCAEAVETAIQLRLTRNASLVRRGGIFMKPTSRKRHQMRARTLFAFFAKSKFGLSRLTGCVERA